MFVWLSKLLPLFVYPLGMVFLLVSGAIFLKKWPGLQRGILIGALVILWTAGVPWTGQALIRSLERRYLPEGEIPEAAVIVVLGGGTQPAHAPRPLPELSGAADRILYGAQLFREGKAPQLLLSGGSIAWMGDRTSAAEEMAQVLSIMGIPEDALWLEEQSRNTYENAVECKKLLEAKGIEDIILVTSAWHMPRAVGVFEAQGLEVIPAPTDFLSTDQSWAELSRPSWQALVVNLVPSAGNLSRTTAALKEYLGLTVYSLRGWR